MQRAIHQAIFDSHQRYVAGNAYFSVFSKVQGGSQIFDDDAKEDKENLSRRDSNMVRNSKIGPRAGIGREVLEKKKTIEGYGNVYCPVGWRVHFLEWRERERGRKTNQVDDCIDRKW